MARLSFALEHGSRGPRAGRLIFSNGIEIETPVFMPVGTAASVKSLRQEDLEEIGYRLILGNTYHLYLRPGAEVFTSIGGLKKFMSWPHAILTDSGGYQAFSLSKISKYTDEGVIFRSHLDGSQHLFSPQSVLDMEAALKSDIVMPIDDCAPYPADARRLRMSLERTHRWLKESTNYMQKTGYDDDQNLFGIVQGGVDVKLRKESAQFARDLNLRGYAIGGLSVGEKNDEFLVALQASCQELPHDKPRYLMGVGSIPEIIHAVELGVDMLDCVLPTRNARNGQVFSSAGKINLRNEKHRLSDRPIDEQCQCRVCQRYSLAYIRHLHKANELLAYTLSTYHNLHFMKRFMESLRLAILNENFENFKKEMVPLFR